MHPLLRFISVSPNESSAAAKRAAQHQRGLLSRSGERSRSSLRDSAHTQCWQNRRDNLRFKNFIHLDLYSTRQSAINAQRMFQDFIFVFSVFHDFNKCEMVVIEE